MDVKEYVLDVIADNGVPFRVVYGIRRNNRGYVGSYPTVAFYDRRYPHDTHGQFVSDYNTDDILSHIDQHPGSGLNLYGGESNWQVDRPTMRLVGRWLHNLLSKS